MKTPVLLLIDWQKAWRDHAYWGRRNAVNAEKNATRLLRAWRDHGAPVIHVRHDSVEPLSPLRPGHPGNDFEDLAEPEPGEPVYSKQVNSAFIGTSLEADLRAAGHHRLVLSGVTTDHCVSTSARMGSNLGFDVTIVGDACFTFDRRTQSDWLIPADMVHNVHLASLNREFAHIATTQEVLATVFDNTDNAGTSRLVMR